MLMFDNIKNFTIRTNNVDETLIKLDKTLIDITKSFLTIDNTSNWF